MAPDTLDPPKPRLRLRGAWKVACSTGYSWRIQQARVAPNSRRLPCGGSGESYEGLDLSQVTPVDCLTRLAAQLSPTPEEMSPVQPILAQAFFDAPYIEEIDVLTTLDTRPNLLDLTPAEFEHLVANLFGKLPRPLEIKPTRRSGDGGFDCVVRDPDPIFGGIVVVQARRYNPAKLKVGVSDVREMYGTMIAEGASNAILVTTTGLTKGAFDFAKDKPLKLISGSHLLALLHEHAGIDATIRSPGRWQDSIKPLPGRA